MVIGRVTYDFIRTNNIKNVMSSGMPHEPLKKSTCTQLIQQLGSENPKQRRAAKRALIKMGKPIMALLEAGLKDRDPEIRESLKEIIEAI
ncbi:hypothetical protein BVY04_00750 [bacterium M21]|nr:hypothetical protein BVY04_00750 [bacterium M21]